MQRGIMKKTLAMFLLLTTSVIAQSAPTQSPAEIAIANAQKTIEKKPTQFSGYNQLAIALARRARETSDVPEEDLTEPSNISPPPASIIRASGRNGQGSVRVRMDGTLRSVGGGLGSAVQNERTSIPS